MSCILTVFICFCVHFQSLMECDLHKLLRSQKLSADHTCYFLYQVLNTNKSEKVHRHQIFVLRFFFIRIDVLCILNYGVGAIWDLFENSQRYSGPKVVFQDQRHQRKMLNSRVGDFFLLLRGSKEYLQKLGF